MGLKQELDREFELFPPSDLWAEIESRATRPEPTELPAPGGRLGGFPYERLVAAVVAFVFFLGALAILWSAFRATSPRPAEPNPSPSDVAPGPRRNGELIEFAVKAGSSGLYLAAQDPETGQLRLFADTSAVIDCYGPAPCHVPGLAAWSADGRWVAFDVFCVGGDPGSCLRQGLWVVGVGGEPRQVAGPCPSCDLDSMVWAWGPAGTGVAYAYSNSGESDLFVFDPSDGTQRSLGRVDGQITALSWAPDGNRIALAAGGGLYLVDLVSGEQSRIATYQGVVGEVWGHGWPAGIKWSPDGTKLVLVTEGDPTGGVQGLLDTWGVQVFDAEGSELFVLPVPGGGPFQGSPEAWWSPDGTQIAYATNIQYRKESGSWVMHGGQIWTVMADGSNPTMVFDPGCCEATYLKPTWSPDGSRLGFEVERSGRPTQWLVVDMGDIGEPQPIGDLTVRSWGGGSFASGGGWTPAHLV
jgi:Tol biopolymer transport system component